MQGRKPYPYALMEATNKKQRLTKDELNKRKKFEPKIQSNFLECPDHISNDAKIEWHRIVALYGELDQQILCDLDSNALEVYCNALVTYRKAIQKVNETSEVYAKKRDNTPRKNPWKRVADEAAEQMKKYGELLLLNPVSRARIGVAKAKSDKELSPMGLYLRDMKKRRVKEAFERQMENEEGLAQRELEKKTKNDEHQE